MPPNHESTKSHQELYVFTRTCFVFFIFFSCNVFSQTEKDIFNYENSRNYAEYLVKTKQYNLAHPELERVLFMNPQNDTVKWYLMESYRNLQLCEAGIKRAKGFFPVSDSISQFLVLRYARLLLTCGEFVMVKEIADKNVNLSKDEKYYVTLNSALFSKNWKEAKEIYDISIDAQKSRYPKYGQLFSDISKVKYKYPLVSAGMSAVIPGSGKLYTKNWKDALIAFVAVGSAAFQSYRGFSKKGMNSTYGWIFGTLAIGFYSGNIYGSHKAAKIYNQKQNDHIYKQVETIFNNDL